VLRAAGAPSAALARWDGALSARLGVGSEGVVDVFEKRVRRRHVTRELGKPPDPLSRGRVGTTRCHTARRGGLVDHTIRGSLAQRLGAIHRRSDDSRGEL